MKVYGIIGWKNAGKTVLMERLVAHITGLGFSVSTVKHVHHDVDLDQRGKDSFRHREAGASEVVLAGAHRFAILREHRGPEPDLAAVLERMAPVDLVLVEGYKRDRHRKIEVFRAEATRDGAGHDLIQPGDALVRAVASDVAGLVCGVPVLDLNDTAAVAGFILREVGLVPAAPVTGDTAFDTVIVVDWSAKAVPSPARPSADAVWTGIVRYGIAETAYHRTRALAARHLAEALAVEAAAGRRVLVGFDFPMGYPAGFAARLTGQARASAVWAWLAARISDGADNANNRFAVAAEVNHLLGGAGPFWGRPAALDVPGLPFTKAVDYPALSLSEFRRVERLAKGAKSVWQLMGAGSVGSQSLMGLPVVHGLAQAGAAVWPFDDTDARVVVVEVYPSLLARAVARDLARVGDKAIKDEAQVRLLALALWRLGQSGGLAALWEVPQAARTEEGWILGAGHVPALEAALEAGL